MNKIVLIYHSTNLHGPIDLLGTFYKEKGYIVSRINNPLDTYENRKTTFVERDVEVYSKNRKKSRFNLILDFFLILHCLGKVEGTPLAIIGANNFDTMAALIYKKFGRKYKNVKIIYFASDFSRSRFNNYLLNKLYLTIERTALRYSDQIISNTNRAELERLKIGLKKEKSLVIPNAVKLDISAPIKKEINKTKFVYVGNVTSEHGLAEIIKKIAHVASHLTLIGDGSDWEATLDLCENLGIKVETHRKKPHDFVVTYLKSFDGIGLAPYNNSAEWTYFCSPLKVSEYIACGLPVIISSVPEVSQIVLEMNLGIVYDDIQAFDFEKNLEKLVTKGFEDRAFAYYQQVNYLNLYDKINL